MFDYQKELSTFLNIKTETTCSDEENKQLRALDEANQPLPPGYRRSTEYFTMFLKPVELPEVEELEQRMKLQNAKNLRTIKNCVIFFTVLAALQLVFGFILSLASSAG